LRIGGLKPRQWRFLTNDEITELKAGETTKKEVVKPVEPKKKNRH